MEGISDEEQVKTQIIEFHGSEMSKTNISRDELKTFMTSKPPSSSSPPKIRPKQAMKAGSDEAVSDAENLKILLYSAC
ncbi:hypothetical protein MMC31_003277 [Peltigera leucophlebia]|nr:hypothetical protein [Peltigera leucophlebia]